MGASEVPDTLFQVAGGQPLLWHLTTRLQRAETPTDLVLATSESPTDTVLADAARSLGLHVHRGAIDDVLGRFTDALDALGCDDGDLVVRVSGLSPLIDPDELDRLVFAFLDRAGRPNQVDYLANYGGQTRLLPKGLEVEVFWAGALRRANVESRTPADREHVTRYLYREGGGDFRTAVSHPDTRDLSYLRLGAGDAQDLAVIDALVTGLGPDASTLVMAAWLDEHPEVLGLNASMPEAELPSDDERRHERIDGGMLLARADAGGDIGFGHVARVTALVDAWLGLGGRATVVGHGITGGALSRLQDLGATVVMGSEKAFESRAPEATALVVDGYAFGAQLQQRWASFGPPLVAIDDVADFPPAADVVVNQNLGFDAARYGATDATLLVGSRYALLRSEFRGPAERPGPGRRRLLMSFGGSDPARLTLPMVRAMLARVPADVTLDVVVGGGLTGPPRAQLERLAELQERRVKLHMDVRDMAALMRTASAAVVAAGSTVWECMACGVPVVMVAVADNQRVVIDGVASQQAGVSLGWHADIDPADAADAVRHLLADTERREALSVRGRELVDGQGVMRVIDALLDAAERSRQE